MSLNPSSPAKYREAMQHLPVLLRDHSLRSFNTMGIDVPASLLAEFASVDELRALVSYCSEQNLPMMVIGGGSNILFTEKVEGCVAVNRMKGIEITDQDEETVLLKVAGGENWHELVRYTVDKKLGGIENLALIPGSVGAAPIQNIGAYGVELSDVFVSLEAFDRETSTIKTFEAEDCAFGYRNSIFKQQLKGRMVITSVTLRLKKKGKPDYSYRSLKDELEERGIAEPSIRDIFEAVIAVRRSKLPDPAELGNTGSFFKNPVISVAEFDRLKQQFPDIPGYPVTERQVKVPAGWLIEQAGWKGHRAGDAGVHARQALVLVNYGAASGAEIRELAEKIRHSVMEMFEVAITPEVNIIQAL